MADRGNSGDNGGHGKDRGDHNVKGLCVDLIGKGEVRVRAGKNEE
jgi:hypothetical protein